MNFSSQYFKHTLYQKIAYCRLETTCNDGLTLCHGDLSCNDDVGAGRSTAGGMGGELRNSFLRESFPQWYPPQYSTVRAMYGMYGLRVAYPLRIGGDLQYDDISVRSGGR